ncbi:hypothetical protein KA107_02450 [Candidatus Pacearchaeota archaeon]|nr:hypothetical protein [Candidatus Pacearchaeota archaeon]
MKNKILVNLLCPLILVAGCQVKQLESKTSPSKYVAEYIDRNKDGFFESYRFIQVTSNEEKVLATYSTIFYSQSGKVGVENFKLDFLRAVFDKFQYPVDVNRIRFSYD